MTRNATYQDGYRLIHISKTLTNYTVAQNEVERFFFIHYTV